MHEMEGASKHRNSIVYAFLLRLRLACAIIVNGRDYFEDIKFSFYIFNYNF